MLTNGTLRLANANAVQNSTIGVDFLNGLSFTSGIGTFTIGGLAGNRLGHLQLRPDRHRWQQRYLASWQ